MMPDGNPGQSSRAARGPARATLIVVFTLPLLILAGCAGSGDADPDPIERATYSVAHILGLNEEGLVTAEGGAFVFREDGYLITRYHFVIHADTVAVLLPGREELVGEVVASDERSDLAIVKVDAGEPLPALSLADQPPYEVDDPVVGLGARYWQRTEVATGRIIPHDDDQRWFIAAYEPFLVVEADDDIGFGGGPLLNQQGQVLGIIASTRNNPLRDSEAPPLRLYVLPATETAAIAGRMLQGDGDLWTDFLDIDDSLSVVGLNGAPMTVTAWFPLWTASAGTTFDLQVVPNDSLRRGVEWDPTDPETQTVSVTIDDEAEGSLGRPCTTCDAAVAPRGVPVKIASRVPAKRVTDAPAAVIAASEAIAQLLVLDPILETEEDSGSAFCFRADGYFITAAHLVPEDKKGRLRVPGHGEVDFEVVGRDPEADLAVLRVEVSSPLPTIPLFDLPEVKRGDRLWAAATPDGPEVQFAPGHMFGINIRNLFWGNFEDYVIADNDTRPGYSGGPLLDEDGRLAGIIKGTRGQFLTDPDQIDRTYATRAVTAAAVAGRLLLGRTPLWTEVGFAYHRFGTWRSFLRKDPFVYVDVDYEGEGRSAVAVLSPRAKSSGFEPHDDVLSLNGSPIEWTDEWKRTMMLAPAGTRLVFRVERPLVSRSLSIGEYVDLDPTKEEVDVTVTITEDFAGSMSAPCPRCDEALRGPSGAGQDNGSG